MEIFKRLLLYIVIMLSPLISGAQYNYDFNWFIGYNYDGKAIDYSRFNFKGFQFHHTLDTVGLEMRGQNITMSNEEGDLLFYSNGCEIRDANHQVIPGSDPLLPGYMNDTYCTEVFPAMPLPQSMIVLPFQINEDSTFYYIYQERDSIFKINDVFGVYGYFEEHLLISENDTPTLAYKDSSITGTYVYTGFVTAVKHANNHDWWLIYPKELINEVESILVTKKGARRGNGKVISTYPSPQIHQNGGASGQMVANLQGDKIALFSKKNEFLYFAFDRQSGQLNLLNRDTLSIPLVELGTRGAQFSPNGRFIYLGTDSFLYQLDTESPAFPTDPVLVAQTKNDDPSGRYDEFSLMQMGPNCKIYIMTATNTDFYHVIHRPNEKGEDCMVGIREIKLKTLNNMTIPLFPNYRLGTSQENWCDSIFDDTTSSSFQFQDHQKQWHIWPNPADEFVKLGHEDGNFGLEAVEIYTFQGQMVRQRSFDALSITYEMNVADLPEGIYLMKLRPKVGREEWHKMVVF